MTSRERILATLLGQPTDRVPYVCTFGPWATALRGKDPARRYRRS